MAATTAAASRLSDAFLVDARLTHRSLFVMTACRVEDKVERLREMYLLTSFCAVIHIADEGGECKECGVQCPLKIYC